MASNHKLVCARAARQQFGGAFQQAVRDYRWAKLAAATLKGLDAYLPDGLSFLPLSYLYDDEVARFAWEGAVMKENQDASTRPSSFRVLARTRPLQLSEVDEKLYESLSSEGGNHSIIVHDGRVHRDGRTIYTNHSRFCLDGVFPQDASNLQVYQEAAQPLLRSALQGERSTLIFFGQTGTGKTYTARGVLEVMTEEIFQNTQEVTLCCYEMAGTRGGREAFFDLLADRAQVKCLTGEDGNVHVRGAKQVFCRSAQDLEEAMAKAFEWRSSECTERNEASSRSHCILELHFPSGSVGSVPGLLRIVDLAGSERNFETQMHSRSMAERGGLINYSLLMLKECARVMHKQMKQLGEKTEDLHVPFRRSRLTHLLRSSFTDPSHQTTVVATLSPSPTDVEHSLNTLQHVGMMRSARAWEDNTVNATTVAEGETSGAAGGFDVVQGRGRALHSKLQDARKGQLNLHAFQMKTQVGGSIIKKYEGDSAKLETFIDARWHRELKVKVQEDLWVLRDADMEATQVLTSWRQEQWTASKAHDLHRWDAKMLQNFLKSLELPGEVRIPSTMTGAQLKRLGPRGLVALCSDAATADALQLALHGERQRDALAAAAHRSRNARMTALGNHKVHAAVEEPSDFVDVDFVVGEAASAAP